MEFLFWKRIFEDGGFLFWRFPSWLFSFPFFPSFSNLTHCLSAAVSLDMYLEADLCRFKDFFSLSLKLFFVFFPFNSLFSPSQISFRLFHFTLCYLSSCRARCFPHIFIVYDFFCPLFLCRCFSGRSCLTTEMFLNFIYFPRFSIFWKVISNFWLSQSLSAVFLFYCFAQWSPSTWVKKVLWNGPIQFVEKMFFLMSSKMNNSASEM